MSWSPIRAPAINPTGPPISAPTAAWPTVLPMIAPVPAPKPAPTSPPCSRVLSGAEQPTLAKRETAKSKVVIKCVFDFIFAPFNLFFVNEIYFAAEIFFLLSIQNQEKNDGYAG